MKVMKKEVTREVLWYDDVGSSKEGDKLVEWGVELHL